MTVNNTKKIPRQTGSGERTYCSHLSQAPTNRALVVVMRKKRMIMEIIKLKGGEKYFCDSINFKTDADNKKDSINKSVANEIDFT